MKSVPGCSRIKQKLQRGNDKREETSAAEKGRAQSHSVLTVNHNEIDEGNNLTDVRHSTTNVNGAKCLWDALEHVQW